jgi:GNAT superfamily N-acetyltransferase
MIRVQECREWRLWKPLRLEALLDTPIGFGERHADAAALTDEQWRVRWARPGFRALAYQAQEPLGMAGGFRNETGEPVLFGVYVRPAARGQGVLAALVDAVAAWAAPDPLVLDVHEDNHRAHAAYLTLDFVDTGGRVPGGGIDGRDLLAMRRA